MLPWPLMMMTGRSGCAFLMRSSSSSPSSLEPCSQMSRITSEGRRSSMACKVSSLSLASRVEWPSSSRMPEISSRISVSSSTTRISDAMGYSLFLVGAFGAAHFSRRFRLRRACLLSVSDRQIDAHRGAFHLAVPLRRIGEREGAAMLLDDTLHDSETEPRALLARGHVRLDQPLAILLG